MVQAGKREASDANRGLTRRRFLAGIGAGCAVAFGGSTIASGQALAGSFTGPNYGLDVRWDESVWKMLFSSLDSPPDPHDWMTMGLVRVPPGSPPNSEGWTLFRTEYAEGLFADIESATRDAYAQYLDDTDSSEDFTELVGSWASAEAVGLLMVQRFYDYDPWIYHEYAVSPVAGLWQRTSITVPEADIETTYLTSLLDAVSINGGSPFKAASTANVVAAMVQATSGDAPPAMQMPASSQASGKAISPAEWVSPLHGLRVSWQSDLFEQPDTTSMPGADTDLLSIYLAGVTPRESVSMQFTPRFGPSTFMSPQEAESYLATSYFSDIAYPQGIATTIWTHVTERAAGMLYYTPELGHGTCAYVEYQAPRMPNTPWVVVIYSMQFGAFDDTVTGEALGTLRVNEEPAFLATPIANVLKDIGGIQTAVLG